MGFLKEETLGGGDIFPRLGDKVGVAINEHASHAVDVINTEQEVYRVVSGTWSVWESRADHHEIVEWPKLHLNLWIIQSTEVSSLYSVGKA